MASMSVSKQSYGGSGPVIQACVRRPTDMQQRIGSRVANGGQALLAENTTAAEVEAVQELTAQCAVDAVCVTVWLRLKYVALPLGIHVILLVHP